MTKIRNFESRDKEDNRLEMDSMPQEKNGTAKGKDSDQSSLPPLSPEDFKIYNAHAERMEEHVSQEFSASYVLTLRKILRLSSFRLTM